MTIKYHAKANNITANKALKLYPYKLDDKDWKIIADLLCILKIYLYPNQDKCVLADLL
jgi:hypothetical protein